MELNELLKRKPMFCCTLMDQVENYFRDPEHEAAFEKWYEEKYGKQYKPDERPEI